MSGFWNKFSSYSMTQLNEMLEDDDKLNKIVQEMEEMQEVQQTKERILASNRSLAEQNLQLQPRLEHQKSQLTKRYSSLQESFEAYQVHKSKLDHTSGNSSLDTLLALLQAEGAKIEEETENMADSFLDGDVTLDTFIDSYQSKRKLAHLRRVKIDKLQEIVLKGHRLPQVPVSCCHPQEVSARPAPLYTEANDHNHSPVPQPRRAPPPPPAQQPPAVAPQPQPAVIPYPVTPYPPIPPRAGHPLPSVNPDYPHPFMSQCPPALPQRPPPRMAPQSGFMIQ
ncbi:vacuolar protein sorting-associated protein 37B-like [Coregonus clupeaformis]|uniref:vacuolar protein sorting-associated protein 37B-like n=1 Tax=Coregonus clupeaformis TaxID=59861 RepID=UPI001E1C3C29|nr:vacuolar protein sorting-associated protein 37B-like [Coregonus clupeaformis]